MYKEITMTQLLTKPAEVRKAVEKGFTVVVIFNGKKIFDIKKHEEDSLSNKEVKVEELPTLKLNVPDNLSRKDIYEKYGA